jgi:hypothetical protein
MHRPGASGLDLRHDGPNSAGPRPRLRHGRAVRGGRLRRFLRRPAGRLVLALFIVFMSWFTWSMGHALTQPGGGTVPTRLAEWARDHYLGPLVTFGEWVTYQPPKVGGKPSFSLVGPGQKAQHASKRGVRSFKPDIPPRLASPAGHPLPGEGIWRVLGSVRREPALFGTFLRPDKVHSSYVAGIVSMDPRLLRFQLHPGVEDPGAANWGVPATIPPSSRHRLRASFNGGFKINSSGGGFYLNGITRGTLTTGTASMVFYRDGRLAIGVWGRDLRMSPDVAGVRQNLRLLVDHGVVPSRVDSNVLSSWGATLGGGYYVWRSGIGVTSDGRIIYVYGPALSARTLADLLKRAGCMEAMQLDINPEWTSFMYYRSKRGASPAPVNVLPTQQQPADRYYSISSRDFTTVYAR